MKQDRKWKGKILFKFLSLLFSKIMMRAYTNLSLCKSKQGTKVKTGRGAGGRFWNVRRMCSLEGASMCPALGL